MSKPETTKQIIIGKHTIEKLRRGEDVRVNGIALIAADDLYKKPEIKRVK